jgi:protein-disulfide isomerase
VKIDPAVGYAMGPRGAPVTIVEFSDFQCPYCKSVVATLKQILARYPDRVRLVFRDYPIPSLHPEAPPAHEAARCAGEQGQFWPYHDLLFERGDVKPAALKQYAADLKLDGPKFAECLDSGRARAAVAADMEEGSRLGVSGTPTFFINGVPLVGNVPLADFQRAVDRELARLASTK